MALRRDKNCAGWALSAYGGRNADVVVVFREQAVVGYRLSEIDFNDVSSWKSGWVDDHRPRMAAVYPHNPEDAQNLQERP
jgi:hypothetical protein